MLEVTDLTKRYADELAVDGLSLSVDEGEFLTLLGPSGSGKTTALLSIAGHVSPTTGAVRIDGEDVTTAPPETRSLGLVFQQDALFPHMTARENVAYALGPHEVADPDCRVETYLSLVGMAAHGEKYPEQLSGGQRRRVELARALVYEPDVLLLDEPLTGLDRQLRQTLRTEIGRIHDETGVTTLYVTHDQEEALTLSDRLAVLDDGELAVTGPPRQLYERPPSEFVANFLGDVSRVPASVRGPRSVAWGGYRFGLDAAISGDRDRLSLYLRPDAVESSLSGTLSTAVVVPGSVAEITQRGPTATLTVETETGSHLQTATEGFPEVSVGDGVRVGFDPADCFAFDGDHRLTVASVERLARSRTESQFE
jgi:ABC-type Fe3+/spermidine/putrescine transport system ATPase subunit